MCQNEMKRLFFKPRDFKQLAIKGSQRNRNHTEPEFRNLKCASEMWEEV